MKSRESVFKDSGLDSENEATSLSYSLKLKKKDE